MGRRPDIDGRQLLLEAALRLFAVDGVEGVSIRAVNREAGLGPASVHYHFGTKDALVDALMQIHGESVTKRIKARAKEITTGNGSPSARDLVLMLAGPYVDVMADGGTLGHDWVRLANQLLQSEPDRVLDRQLTRLTRGAAARVFPDAASDDVARAMRMCFTLLLAQMARPNGRTRSATAPPDFDLLVDFLSAGLEATLATAPLDRRRPA